ncbi:MAG: TIGR00730 family Rossman fold protein [Clostridia bacterium]|nr:TIGR00730 family Rossman fold protein [Clostridia bacterium]
MNITVYLGSNTGNSDRFISAIKELGAFIGQRGDTLVYGGSKIGLMGILADSVLASGGPVIGVEPQMFVDEELQHSAITELIVTENMSERKAKMIELGDAFIAFPGGLGTLEEISEIMSLVSLGIIDSPCILYDLDGYYNCLKELLDTMISYELSSKRKQKDIRFVSSISEIEEILNGVEV